MYPSNTPPGYEESWRLVISVYPPVSVETMQGVLGGHGYPGGLPAPGTNREVRVNAAKAQIEIWERQIVPQTRIVTNPQGTLQQLYQTAPRGAPGTVHRVDIREQ